MANWYRIDGRFFSLRNPNDPARPVGLVEGTDRVEFIIGQLKWQFRSRQCQFLPWRVNEHQHTVAQLEIKLALDNKYGRAYALAAGLVLEWDKKLPADPKTPDPVATVELRPSKVDAADESEAIAAPESKVDVTLRKTKPKRSAAQGDGPAKLIPALTKHHNYADDGVLNQEPIGNNALARMADVDQSTASLFFKQRFKGHGKYKAMCADAARLAAALKLLNGEFSPHLLYGSQPPGQEERDDE